MFSFRNLIAIAGAVIVVMTAGQAAAISYTNDACVYYPVESYGGTTNDTVMDASTNSQDGIADGDVFNVGGQPIAGLNGNSAVFPGGADIYVAGEKPPSSTRFQNDTLLLGTNDYTVMMWVRATGAYNINGGTNGLTWTAASGLFNLFLDQNGSIVYTVTNDTATMGSTSSAAVPVDSEWYHVAVVVNRDNLGSNPSAIYLDSSDVTGANTMEDTPTSLDPALNDFWQWGRALSGQGDDFAIFKQALSQADIIELNGFAPTTSTTSSTTLTTSTSTSTSSTLTSTTTSPFGYTSACVWYPVEYYTNVGVGGNFVTVPDHSGNGQDGLGGGNMFMAGPPTAGINGNSAVFPGGGDINVAGEAPPSTVRNQNQTLALDTNDFTVMMWVRATASYCCATPGSVFLPANYALFLDKSGSIQIEVPANSATMATAPGTAIPADSEWYHVAVVVNRDNTNGNPSAIYVNSGNLTSDPMEDTPTAMAAGNSGDEWGRALRGQGDDFAIFKEALSQAQIVALTGVTSTSSTSSTSTFSTTSSTSTQSSTTSTSSTTSPYNQACLHYPLETYGGTQADTVVDASGNGQDGIADGDVFPLGTTPGLNGNSAIFPGPGGDIYCAGEVPPSGNRFRNQTLALETNDYTIMMWVRATGAYHDLSGANGLTFTVPGIMDLFLSKSGTIEYAVTSDSASMASTVSSAIPVDSEWYHVAVTVNRDNLGGNPSAIYVNSANATGANTMEDTPTSLVPGGAEFWQFGRAINGQADDFAIFKEALSLAEITVLNGLTSTTSSTTSSTITSTTSTSSSTTFSTTTSSTSTTSTSSTTSPVIDYEEDACVYYPVESYGGTTNDTVVDATVNSQDGIADDEVLPLGTSPGINGNAANFPGGNDIYVAGEVPPSSVRFQNDTLLLGTNDYTVMMWVRATSAYNVPNGPDGKVWTATSGRFDLFLSRSNKIEYVVGPDNATMTSTNGADIPVNSEWYHVAVVVNRDNVGGEPSAIYVNGVDVTGTDTMEDTPMPLDPAANDFWQWGRALSGQGDDFAVFKEALSDNEIRSLAGLELESSAMLLIIR